MHDPDTIGSVMCTAMDRDAVAAGYLHSRVGEPPAIVELPLMSDLGQATLKAQFNGQDDDPARIWLRDNAFGAWRSDGAKIIFSNRADAMLFVLAHRSADCLLTVEAA